MWLRSSSLGRHNFDGESVSSDKNIPDMLYQVVQMQWCYLKLGGIWYVYINVIECRFNLWIHEMCTDDVTSPYFYSCFQAWSLYEDTTPKDVLVSGVWASTYNYVLYIVLLDCCDHSRRNHSASRTGVDVCKHPVSELIFCNGIKTHIFRHDRDICSSNQKDGYSNSRIAMGKMLYW